MHDQTTEIIQRPPAGQKYRLNGALLFLLCSLAVLGFAVWQAKPLMAGSQPDDELQVDQKTTTEMTGEHEVTVDQLSDRPIENIIRKRAETRQIFIQQRSRQTGNTGAITREAQP